jgi:hypothetical protein
MTKYFLKKTAKNILDNRFYKHKIKEIDVLLCNFQFSMKKSVLQTGHFDTFASVHRKWNAILQLSFGQ